MNTHSCLLDTSYLVRLLTRDPLPLFEAAAAFLEKWAAPMPTFIVTDLVLSEAYYALQYHYSFPKAETLAALRGLASHPAVAFTPHAREILALPNLASAKPGFVDRLIHGAARATGATLITFEKSARKLPDTEVLE